MSNIINKDFTYAVVGASNNKEKYGYKVLKDLSEASYKVLPINPKGGEILGLKVFKNILEIKEKIDVVVFVVPSEVTLKVLRKVKEREINKVWMQPGSGSEEVVEFCKKNNIEYISEACIMIQRINN
jgi:uncharacterized protein